MTEQRSVVPLIDIAPFESGGAEEKADIAAQVGRACEEIGFLVITGHGVDRATVDEMRDVSAEFFALPLAEKLQTVSPVGDAFQGYSPPAAPVAAAGTPTERPNLLEMFHTNRYDSPEQAVALGYPVGVVSSMQPNLWPARPERFRPVWESYYREMEALAARMLRIFAVALDLPETWFDDKVDRHLSNLAANCYPEQLEPPLPGQLRSAAHVDFATLTLLHQDDAPGGLEVYRRDVGWVAVRHIPGTYVVNLGDLMARWTNDRWVATNHRVVNPPREQAMTRRISVPFFHQPNHDAVIESIPSCVDSEHPSRYRPVLAGEWIEQRRLGRPANYGRVAS